jgi:OOP family OmpA-OmpF porin
MTLAVLAQFDAPAFALSPDLPGTVLETRREVEPFSSYTLPMGEWRDGILPGLPVEGRITRRAWRIEEPPSGTLSLLAPLRDQLRAEGFSIVFECDTTACGGFDFRFATEVLAEPDMHVDLGDFRFVSATREDGAAVTLMVSRSMRAGHVQMVEVTPTEMPPVIAGPEQMDADRPSQPGAGLATTLSTASGLQGSASLPSSVEAGEVGAVLDSAGGIVLEGLEFPSGEARLLENTYPVLASLAAWLKADAGRMITLVGHTDASGGLEPNILLSRRRAEAVRERLIDRHGIEPARIAAEGVGYLSPRDSNRTEEGRTRNRRVEAIVTSTR